MPVSSFWSRLATANCPFCRRRPPRFDEAFALGAYRGELRWAVRQMKQAAHEPLCETLGALLAQQVAVERGEWQVDLVVPLPMHWRRRLVRQTNPAETLAEVVSGRLRLEVDCHVLEFRRKIKKQGTLTPAQRRQNVSGALRVRAGYDLAGLRVLLLDDIMTTGATADAAAGQLRRAGARRVAVAVVARGSGAALPDRWYDSELPRA